MHWKAGASISSLLVADALSSSKAEQLPAAPFVLLLLRGGSFQDDIWQHTRGGDGGSIPAEVEE